MQLTQNSTNPDRRPLEDEQTRCGRRHRYVRAQRSTMVVEDYVEVIGDLLDIYGEARIIDIAYCRGVSHPTAVKAMDRLKREGLVISRPYRAVFLTEEGKRLAERVRIRHLVVVKVLLAIGVPKEVAENDAEGIEYYVSDISLAAFEKFLCRTD